MEDLIYVNHRHRDIYTMKTCYEFLTEYFNFLSVRNQNVRQSNGVKVIGSVYYGVNWEKKVIKTMVCYTVLPLHQLGCRVPPFLMTVSWLQCKSNSSINFLTH